MTERQSESVDDALTGTSNVLASTYQSLTEGLTGILSSERKDWTLSIGHLFQRIRGREFLEEFNRQWNEYRDKGRVKTDYEGTEQHKACLQELLEFLDRDSPEAVRFSAMQSILLNAATETLSDRESMVPHQYMQICRGLSSGELLVLRAVWNHNAGREIQPSDNTHDLAAASGLAFTELVDLHRRALLGKRLVAISGHGWTYLTGLGKGLCNFIVSDGCTEQGDAK